MEQRDPEPHWKTFKLLKVKLRSNSLQECDDYNYTTSLETENEDNTIDVGLQNVTKASGKSDSSGKAARSSGQKASSGMGASSQVSTFQKPRLPSVKPLSTAVSNKASASPIYHSSSKTKSYPERENTSPDLENDFTPPPKRRRHIEDESISTPPSRVTKRMSKSLFPLSDETYQYKTINLLFDIREELRKLTNDKEIDLHDNNLQEFQICESVEDFQKFEDNLTNPAYNKNMLKSMSKVGGNSWKDNTRNVMRRLMKNRLMSEFNMEGQRGKRKLVNDFDKFTELVQDAVLANFGKKTKSDIKVYMGQILKRAPDMKGGSGRPEKVHFEMNNQQPSEANDEHPIEDGDGDKDKGGDKDGAQDTEE